MTTTILAVYQGGMLRPFQPLDLKEGDTVALTIAKLPWTESNVLRPPTPEELDYAQRVTATRSLEELFAVMATADPGHLTRYVPAELWSNITP